MRLTGDGMMSEPSKAQQFADRFAAYHNEVVALVETCSDENWRKVCRGEHWTVGVVAFHIVYHYEECLRLARGIVENETMPGYVWDDLNRTNADMAQDRAACTQQEVLRALQDAGASVLSFVAGLSDEELDRYAYLELVGGYIRALHAIEDTMGGGHLASIKATVAA
jgi:hypothetical protein